MVMKRLCALITALILLGTTVSSLPARRRRYDAVFSFGDSFADTGHPTGRNSDGRLIIDFIAEELGLPLVPPFLAHNGSFRHGANFAVSGATALGAAFFADLPRVSLFVRDTSSSVQLRWFESLKPSLCSSAHECKGFFKNSLFFMGEFGVNDYGFSASIGKSLPQIRSLVPDVIKTISAATENSEGRGKDGVVVPGVPPLGCAPSNLVQFPSVDPEGYDSRAGCLKQFNDLAMHLNSLLQEAIKNVQTKHRNVRVIYADFFTPIIRMIESPHKFGFNRDILRCCCGGGGNYNFNSSAGCGTPGSTLCDEPSAYLYWDGHLTEAASRHIARSWLNSINNRHV
ncbi:hypothetical protein ACP4OV_020757 [Aristida adscensionis]